MDQFKLNYSQVWKKPLLFDITVEFGHRYNKKMILILFKVNK